MFDNVSFNSVERPFVFVDGCYFQNAHFKDVNWNNSGTFHSEGTDLVGTLMYIDNCNHEGSVPANSEKIVCNLQAIRQIKATNFLLEGALPEASTWTVEKVGYGGTTLGDPYVRCPIATMLGHHIEFSGANAPLYTIDHSGGIVTLVDGSLPFTTSSVNRYKLSASGLAVLQNLSISASSNRANDFFDIEDAKCRVILRGGNCRSIDRSDNRFVLDNISIRGDGGATSNALFAPIQSSNTASELLYAYDGKNPEDYGLTLGLFGSTTCKFDTDSTFGRKISFVGSAGNWNGRYGFLAG